MAEMLASAELYKHIKSEKPFMCKEWQPETEINKRKTRARKRSTECRMREDMWQQNACVFLYRKTCYTGCGNLAEYLAGGWASGSSY
jgi:hypothetical protein